MMPLKQEETNPKRRHKDIKHLGKNQWIVDQKNDTKNTEKPLAKLTERRKNTLTNKLRGRKGDITTDTNEIHKII
jgi:hypothetical protein